MSLFNSMKRELIPYDDLNWASNINTYQQEKKTLRWGTNSMPRYITHKMMKERDCNYNPLIQKYNNDKEDKAIRADEETHLKRSLSQYYDNSLRYEQTFDLINLADRLKGFENHPDYPHDHQKKQKQNKETSRVKYNILSNISLNQHSALPPEMRPPNNDHDVKSKPRIINSFLHKDYDIISNKYKENHDEKAILDHRIHELNASKQLQERKGYSFMNSDRNDIQEQYSCKSNQHKRLIPKTPLYNPVNHSILDEERLKLMDQKENNKHMRYKVKQETEEYYRIKAIQDDINREAKMKNHQSYSRYRAFDQRGYEAINHQRNFGYYRKNFHLQNDKTDWELIQSNTSNNETFSTKPIYRPLYDKSDLDPNLDQFYLDRKALLESLPKLEDQESFKRSKNISKLDHEKLNEEINNNYYKSIHGNKVDIDKTEWFKIKKDVGVGG